MIVTKGHVTVLVLGPIIVSGLGRVASFEVYSQKFSTNSCQNSFNSLFLINNLNLKLIHLVHILYILASFLIPDAQLPVTKTQSLVY